MLVLDPAVAIDDLVGASGAVVEHVIETNTCREPCEAMRQGALQTLVSGDGRVDYRCGPHARLEDAARDRDRAHQRGLCAKQDGEAAKLIGGAKGC
ncbi:hypothetical protein ACFVOK_18690 [Streptomyces sp. NPDC057798]|uniref:hypothetical protein n=1 Tax=Streptomyces sp. NPDC057798 TaxID=3346252 RepID=UPI00368A549A